MNNYDELKKLAEAANNPWPSNGEERAFREVATPAAVLGLLSELTALRAAASAPKAELTDERIRAAGGIVHKDGNIFFKNIDVLRAVLAQAAPVAVPAKPVAWMKFRAAQSWDGRGDIDHNEWLEVCQPGEIGDDKLPAFPVYAAPAAPVAAAAEALIEKGYAKREGKYQNIKLVLIERATTQTESEKP